MAGRTLLIRCSAADADGLDSHAGDLLDKGTQIGWLDIVRKRTDVKRQRRILEHARCLVNLLLKFS